MLPGKTYTPEDILQIFRRRIWLVLVPFAVISAATAYYARKLPNRYVSRATIVVLPQRVSEAYVRAAVTSRLADRLPTIAQRVTGRQRLQDLITEFNLYPEALRTGNMTDVIDRMRVRDIKILPSREDAFSVGFESNSPQIALNIATRLASAFLDENTIDRSDLAETTLTFLDTQLGEAKANLENVEKKLEAYRVSHSGRLPSQEGANITALQNTWTNITSLTQSANRNKERHLFLEQQRADLQKETPDDAAALAGPPMSEGMARQLAAARGQLSAYELRGLTDSHPDVVLIKKQIAEIVQAAEKQALTVPLSDAAGTKLPPAEQARRDKAAAIQAELNRLDKQIADEQAQEETLRANAKAYQARIDGVPERESEMTALMRDYSVLQGSYTSLLAKRGEYTISVNLERNQNGQKFQLIEPARLPETPSSPDRPRLTYMGMAAGIGIGLALIALLEYRDSSFKMDTDISRLLSLPVLAVIPVMESARDKRRALIRGLMLGIGLGGVVAACLAVVAYTFVR